MILAVASGKGGTGKTTVSLNLAKTFGSNVQVLDCDVEEPNDHLFLDGAAIKEEIITIQIPRVDGSLCDGCGECGRFCEYHAIVSLGTKPLIFPDMCHGCGGCAKVCPRKAIHEVDKRIGVVETVLAGNITLIQGRMDVGIAMAPPLIRAVKARLQNGVPAILDAPPGPGHRHPPGHGFRCACHGADPLRATRPQTCRRHGTGTRDTLWCCGQPGRKR